MDKNNMGAPLGALIAEPALEELAQMQPAQAFNIFEALGDVRQERLHSNVLFFLLNPHGAHRLGDTAITRLLQRVGLPMHGVPASSDAGPMHGSPWTVHREYAVDDPGKGQRGYIDILLLNHDALKAVIIENKIDSGERGDELTLYYDGIRVKGWDVRGIYLTPLGNLAMHSAYSAVGYGTICEVIKDVLTAHGGLDDAVRTMFRHYVHMLRRSIVNQSETDLLCHRIYRTHRLAIEQVRERVLRRQDEIAGKRTQLVGAEAGQDGTNKRFSLGKKGRWENAQIVRFIPVEWAGKPPLQSPQFSDDLGCILEFQGFIWPQGVDLYLKIGPGEAATRKCLYKVAQQAAGPFEVGGPLAQGYIPVYTRQLLDPESYEQFDLAGLAGILQEKWIGFVQDDLPRIERAIGSWLARVA